MQMMMIGFEESPIINTACDSTLPWCTIEHWMTLVCLIFGAGFYAILISSIEVIFSNYNDSRVNMRAKLQTANDYMRWKDIPMTIKSKVREFYRFQNRESFGKTFDEVIILGQLTPNLQAEITLHNQRKLVIVKFLVQTRTRVLRRRRLAKTRPHPLSSSHALTLALAHRWSLCQRSNTADQNHFSKKFAST